MIECIFTLDYEIYGNGFGALKDLVYEPARKLKDIFDRNGVKMVVFVEVAELEKIEVLRTDPFIDDVKKQIRELYKQGHEIGLHLHPQWCNARFEKGSWILDSSEYNLCALGKKRIKEIIEGGVGYLRDVLGNPDFTPTSFRAGNWLLQPTEIVATVLHEHGIRIDSSVFKGGFQPQHKLDYRKAAKNGYFWKFQGDVAVPDPQGALLEMPIHTQMVPFWKMGTRKRISIQKKGPGGATHGKMRLSRYKELLRFKYPLKFDFCCMTIGELTTTIDSIIRHDQSDPSKYRPIVLIGHTKDLCDLETLVCLLDYLREKSIEVLTLEEIYPKVEIYGTSQC